MKYLLSHEDVCLYISTLNRNFLGPKDRNGRTCSYENLINGSPVYIDKLGNSSWVNHYYNSPITNDIISWRSIQYIRSSLVRVLPIARLKLYDLTGGRIRITRFG